MLKSIVQLKGFRKQKRKVSSTYSTKIAVTFQEEEKKRLWIEIVGAFTICLPDFLRATLSSQDEQSKASYWLAFPVSILASFISSFTVRKIWQH